MNVKRRPLVVISNRFCTKGLFGKSSSQTIARAGFTGVWESRWGHGGEGKAGDYFARFLSTGVDREDQNRQILDKLVALGEKLSVQNQAIDSIGNRLQSLENIISSGKGNSKKGSEIGKHTPSPVPRGKSPRGFVDYQRAVEPYRKAEQRVRDWGDINATHADPAEQKRQAARCMDCGTPFCHTHTGCPVNNLIPEWNELVLKEEWREASDRLHATNNFPEFTGRVCPAPCESACVAGLVDKPVTIKNIEYAIVDRAWKEGWLQPKYVPNERKTGKRVAIVGSGPAGLACADNLNQLGHDVTVFEREDSIGGLLFYGIPNPKLDKREVDRRVALLREEGIEFRTGAHVGVNVDARELRNQYDAIVLTVGATKPRGLTCENADLKGVYSAMEFLTGNQRDLKLGKDGSFHNNWGDSIISAEGKNVLVIGGGDTGTDCIGTSLRQYCKSVVNLELLPINPDSRDEKVNPWPQYLKTKKIDYGHEEAMKVLGADPRKYSVNTKRLISDEEGNVTGVVTVDLEWKHGKFVEIPNSEKTIACDMVLLAMGFLGPESSLTDAFHLDTDSRGNIKAQYGKFDTSLPGIFAAGDCRRGQSLVVWAINEGRGAANAAHKYLVQ